MRSAVAELDSPEYKAEAQQQDMDPRNFQMLDQEMQRARSPMQKQVLMGERQRLEQAHAQQLLQAAQQLKPNMEYDLSLQKHVGEQVPTPEAFMAKLMVMIQRRNGRQNAY